MLDKSVAHAEILMRREKGRLLAEIELPEGFSFVRFKSGCEKEWAKIEASVLEFDGEPEALEYYNRNFMPYLEELERRCLFIANPGGEKVATGTAWWNYTGLRRDPWIHWIAVKPEYQGMGLGKAIISKIIWLMTQIEGERDFYLHTQTWSHKAVRIYEKLGFSITDERPLASWNNNDYEKALEIMSGIEKGEIQ